MTHCCENCDFSFEIELHKLTYTSVGSSKAIMLGTGKNVVYRGDKRSEYAICPECGCLESDESSSKRSLPGNL